MLPTSRLPEQLPSSLAELAELVHTQSAPVAPVIVAVENCGRGRSHLTTHIVPIGCHPTIPLFGVLVPARWSAIGLVAMGQRFAVAGADAPPADGTVCVTHMVDRAGASASVIGAPDGSLDVITEPPVGWVADALTRSLGLPTPPPAHTPAAWADAVWLDRVATGVFRHPRRRWTWPLLVARHPVVVSDPVPTPGQVAAGTAAFAARIPWSEIRRRHCTVLDPDENEPLRLPGEPIPVGEWLDDGSMSRLVLRDLPPPELLLTDLLAVLPTHVGDCLATAVRRTSPRP